MHMATKTKVWTLEEVHSLPDDGNKYELVRGELFVTPPPPGGTHETILARLSRILDPYVESQKLGLVFHLGPLCASKVPRSNRISWFGSRG